MSLVKTDKSMKEILINLHQDLFINNFSVHDEIVNIMDRHLHQPLALQMIRIVELQKVFKQLGVPYITFKFDVEYDKWGSYTATSALNPYKYHLDICKFFLKKNAFNEDTSTPDTNVVEVEEEIKQPDTKQPDTKQPDTKQPDTKQPKVIEVKINSYDEFLQIFPKMNFLKTGQDTIKIVLFDGSVFVRQNVDLVDLKLNI